MQVFQLVVCAVMLGSLFVRAAHGDIVTLVDRVAVGLKITGAFWVASRIYLFGPYDFGAGCLVLGIAIHSGEVARMIPRRDLPQATSAEVKQKGRAA